MVTANLANAGTGVKLLLTTLRTMPVVGTIVNGAFNLMSLGAKGLGVAIGSIPIIGWIAIAITAIGALAAYFYNTSAQFRGVLMGVWEFIKTVFLGYYKFIWEIMQAIWHVIKGVFNPKNWFDSNYKFSDAIDKVANAAKQYGESIGKAYGEGREKGMESYYKDHPEERPKTAKKTSSATSLEKKNTGVVTPTVSLSSSSGKSGLSGSGIGGTKTINQKIEIKNYFTVSEGGSLEAIAEKVVRVINDRLRDATVALQ